MPVNILLQRDRSDIPFGFKLQGGSDFSIPLSVQTVNENSLADRAGLRPGDAILCINNVETSWMDHARAKQEIIRAGNDILLTVDRNAVALEKPKYTPLSELKCLPPQDPTTFSAPPAPKKTDLTVQKEESIKIGSSHNRAPMPFNKEVGNSMVYQSAKATNWQPGDYTKYVKPSENQQQQQQPQSPTVTAVFHNPYNTPIGLYSDDNVFDAFSHQTKGIMNPELTTQSKGQPRPTPQQHQPPPQQQQQQQQQHHVQPQQQQQPNQVPKGVNSLSMRMLNSALDTVEGTSIQAPSVFDLKRGNNPTGATVPKGFRSVQAPTLPPPEERHAPVRKEYAVSHVKQSWVEPK